MNDKRNQLLINVLTWVVLLTPVWALLYGLYVFDHGFGVIALTAFLFFLPVYIGYILSSTTEAVYKDNNLTYKQDIKSICFRTSFLFFTSNAEITTRFGKVCFTGRLIKPSAKDMANSKGTYGYGMVVEVDEDVVAPGLKTVRNFFMVNKVVVKSGTERWILYFFAITVFLLLQFGDRLVFLLTKFVTN